MIILGVDPGTLVTGYGIISVVGQEMVVLDCGCIKPPKKQKLSDRYLIIYNALLSLIEQYEPDCLVVETQYVDKNPQSAIKLGMARGVATIAGKSRGLSIYEYAPTEAKRAVVGTGRASKKQVQGMAERLLGVQDLPEDAADALALAICHSHSVKMNRTLNFEL